MPFDTVYWLNEPGVRLMPPELRSVWVDILCYLWQSKERGVLLTPTGLPYTLPGIAKQIACTKAQIQMLIDRSLLMQRRTDNAYYYERMVKADALSKMRREVGKRGGANSLAKRQQITTPVQPQTEPVETVVEPILPNLIDETTPKANPPELTEEEKKKAQKAKKYDYAEFVKLTRDEYAKLCEQLTEPGAKRCIEILDNYKGQSGKKYKSDYRAILNWVVNRYEEELNGNNRYGHRPGVENAQRPTTIQLPPLPATSGGGEEKTQKGYGERF